MHSSSVKHLLIISPGFAGSEDESTCLPAVQQFIKCYSEQFPETKVTIVAVHYPFVARTYLWHGITVHALGGKNRNGIGRAVVIKNVIQCALRVNRAEGIDAILSLWLGDTALCGKYISNLLKLPHLIWMHGQDARAGNKYVKWVKPKPENLLAISSYQNEVFHKSYGFKAAHIAHNGINSSAFPIMNTGKREIDILGVGSLIPLKRYDIFFDTVKKLMLEGGYKNLKVVLAGEGELETQFRKRIADEGLEDNVTLTGKITHPQVLELMNNSRLFLHPSSYEGHSTVMLEALYSGCHVLSFIPVSVNHVAQFTLCATEDELYAQLLTQLTTAIEHSRVVVSDMKDTAQLIHNLFLATKEKYAATR